MKSNKAFTVAELMVGIVVFTLGLLWAYALISSANSLSLRSKDEIIVANILREQIELVKNMRDGNWIRSKNWNSIDNNGVSSLGTSTVLEPGNYVIENNYSDTSRPIKIQKLSLNSITENTIATENAQISGTTLRLCIDENGRYTHDCSDTSRKRTPLFSYITIEKVQAPVSGGSNEEFSWALAVNAYVYATDAGIRLYDMHTIITDWKK